MAVSSVPSASFAALLRRAGSLSSLEDAAAAASDFVPDLDGSEHDRRRALRHFLVAHNRVFSRLMRELPSPLPAPDPAGRAGSTSASAGSAPRARAEPRRRSRAAASSASEAEPADADSPSAPSEEDADDAADAETELLDRRFATDADAGGPVSLRPLPRSSAAAHKGADAPPGVLSDADDDALRALRRGDHLVAAYQAGRGATALAPPSVPLPEEWWGLVDGFPSRKPLTPAALHALAAGFPPTSPPLRVEDVHPVLATAARDDAERLVLRTMREAQTMARLSTTLLASVVADLSEAGLSRDHASLRAIDRVVVIMDSFAAGATTAGRDLLLRRARAGQPMSLEAWHDATASRPPDAAPFLGHRLPGFASLETLQQAGFVASRYARRRPAARRRPPGQGWPHAARPAAPAADAAAAAAAPSRPFREMRRGPRRGPRSATPQSRGRAEGQARPSPGAEPAPRL